MELGDDDQEGKPKRTSLPKGTEPADVDLDVAVHLLTLPRTLGEHPETGSPIKANIGRFGPYVQHGSSFASLKKDHVLDVGLERALELLAAKKKKNEPLRTLGNHPDTNEPIGVYDGRYGPYVKHRKTNATIPKDMNPDSITLEEAVVLINEKAAKKGRGRGRAKKKAKA